MNVERARVYIDDVPVCAPVIGSTCSARSPLAEPVMVNPGRHVITAKRKGWSTGASLVSVVAADKVDARIELVELVP